MQNSKCRVQNKTAMTEFKSLTTCQRAYLPIGKLSCAIRSSLSPDLHRGSTSEVRFLSRTLGYLLRKEVIQPQVPLRLPCYDFIPITIHTFGICLLAVSTTTSGTNGFHDVTGGVYKAWERIHGAVADAPLLAIPASCRRVADDNLNWARFLGICSILRSCFPLCRAL